MKTGAEQLRNFGRLEMAASAGSYLVGMIATGAQVAVVSLKMAALRAPLAGVDYTGLDHLSGSAPQALVAGGTAIASGAFLNYIGVRHLGEADVMEQQ